MFTPTLQGLNSFSGENRNKPPNVTTGMAKWLVAKIPLVQDNPVPFYSPIYLYPFLNLAFY